MVYRPPDTIKCSNCGKDSGIPKGPLHMVIPPEGIKCHQCGNVIIRGSNVSWLSQH